MLQPILIVDDDPTISYFVTAVLEAEGYEVLTASDGLEALRIAQEDTRIDLVLSDIVMPGMSGVQLCKTLKRSRPEVKCILMSGYDMGLLASDWGTHFLPKPFYPNDLLEIVRQVLALQPC